jgi:hypothetical protein
LWDGGGILVYFLLVDLEAVSKTGCDDRREPSWVLLLRSENVCIICVATHSTGWSAVGFCSGHWVWVQSKYSTPPLQHPTPAHRDEERWAREKKGNYWDGEQAARRTWPQVRAHFYFHDQRVHVTRRAARCPLGIGNFYPAVLDRVVRPWPHESRGLGSACQDSGSFENGSGSGSFGGAAFPMELKPFYKMFDKTVLPIV